MKSCLRAISARRTRSGYGQHPGGSTVSLKQLTLRETPLFRLLLAIRMLPARLAGQSGFAFDAERPLYEQFLRAGFPVLAEAPDRELVVGRIAQFWKLWGGSSVPIQDSGEFVAFAQRGYAKAAVNFRVEHSGTAPGLPPRLASEPPTRRHAERSPGIGC